MFLRTYDEKCTKSLFICLTSFEACSLSLRNHSEVNNAMWGN